MKRVRGFLIIAIICLFCNASAGQSSIEIMDKYFMKMGGIKKIQSIVSFNKQETSWDSVEEDMETKELILTGTFHHSTTVVKLPHHLYTTIVKSSGRQGIKSFRNEQYNILLWPYGEIIESDKDVGYVSSYINPAIELLAFYKEDKLKLVGDTVLKGTEYTIISGPVISDGASNLLTAKYYFDKKSGLLVIVKTIGTTTYSDYHAVEGLLFPFRIDVNTDLFKQKTLIDSIQINPVLSDSIFYYKTPEIVEKKKYENKVLENTQTDLKNFVKVNFKNKRVFLDLWATWCGPCKREFKNYDSAYYAFMEKQNINLVYLSLDKETDKEKWEADIKKLGLKGFHAMANTNMVQDIQRSIFGGGAMLIPRYVLINEAGKILSNDFKKPSDPSFMKALDNLFKKKE